MNRQCKNDTRPSYTPTQKMTDAGKGNRTEFDGRKNLGAKDTKAVGKTSPLRDPKTLHYAPK